MDNKLTVQQRTREEVDQGRMNEFLGRFVADLGATFHAPTVLLGEKLGLYKTMAAAGPVTPAELAARTDTSERYVREWLEAQAAAGYAMYDPKNEKYWLSPEQAFALANESSSAYLPGAFYLSASLFSDWEKVAEAFRTGRGLGWHEHSTDLFKGTEKFFRPGYVANIVASWLPALDGVVPKLERGAKVADIGCGHGASTIIMAKAYPNSTFVGYDYHDRSIHEARRAAEREGLDGRVRFEVASAKSYPGSGFDLATIFDALHDMGDPVGAAQHVRQSLKEDGTWMIVEPYSNERVEENLNPIGRIFYSASTLLCTPSSLSQEVGLALGAQAGDSRLRQVVAQGGFTRFRRATQTPFNRIFEARP
jgi:SAM-dependent methyltransferase